MNKNHLFFLTIFTASFCLAGEPTHLVLSKTKAQKQTVTFTENKGQVCDQYYKPRQDVLFSGTDGKLVFHLKNHGLSYQLNRIDKWREITSTKGQNKSSEPSQATIYRLDINWLNINPNTEIVKGLATGDLKNFYLEQCPQGALNVKSYEDITYKNIYAGIDLKWYQKDGHLKYDYLVSAGADYNQITLELKGSKKMYVNRNGELVIETPLGEIIEQAPLVVQNNKVLKSKWLLEGNIVKINIEGVNPKQPFVIDPVVCVRSWGTYYGGAGQDRINSCVTNASGEIFIAGTASSSLSTVIATNGAHQTIHGGGFNDAFVAKFSAVGARVWATYYGGSSSEDGNACAVNNLGEIFLIGTTTTGTSTLIASAGAHQTTFGGLYDAFLVKFNAAGVRQWGTYYGGAGDDRGLACATNTLGDVYISGYTSTSSSTAIATSGSHQLSKAGISGYDAFLAKFNSSGVRQWGTYYGDVSYDYGYACAVNSSGDVFMVGSSLLSTGTTIATATSYQPVLGGSTDAFIVKFNSSGVRQWATYYGGSGDELALACAVNSSGDIYIGGSSGTYPGTIIATPGAHQTIYGGDSSDGFLAKFNSAGTRQWGTYYGDSYTESIQAVAVSSSGDVYVAGEVLTYSTSTVFASYGSHQQAHAGGTWDAFLGKFNSSGIRQWGTYYGGENSDIGRSCATNTLGEVYLAGYSASTLAIGSSGSYQSANGGGDDGFLAKFSDCTTPSAPANVTSSGNQTICATNTTTLMSTGSGTISWYSSPTSTTALQTGTAFATPTLSVGTYTYFSEAFFGCISDSRTAITITVNPRPTVTANNGSICSGNSFTIVPGGAGIGSTYTISSGSTIVTPTTNTSYSVTGSSSLGCLSSNTAVSTVTVNITPIIGVNSGSICAGAFFTLVPSGASTYTISGGSTFVNPLTNMSYSVIGKSVQGCAGTNTAVANITVNATPTIGVNNGAICLGSSFVIVPNGANTYTVSGNNFTVNPTANSSYSVTGTSSLGCVGSNTAVSSITVNTLPVIAVNNGTICSGGTFTMSPTGALTYTYSNGSPTVSPVVNSSFSITGTSSLGCLSSNTAISSVTVYNLPLIGVNNGTICSGNSFTLLPAGGTSYTYSSGSAIVSPASTSTYTVTGSNSQGCSNTAVSIVSVNPSPTISVNSGSLCSGSIFTLSPMGAFVYTFSSGSATVAPMTNSLYYVSGVSAQGCAGSNTAIATVSVFATPAITANSGSICAGQQFIITPSGASNYTFSSGTATVSPATTSTYSVSTSNTQGCIGVAISTVFVDACLGLEKTTTDKNSLLVFPNPNNGNFSIETDSEIDIIISNAYGQIVTRKTLTQRINNISLGQVASGVYLIITKKGTFKVVKE